MNKSLKNLAHATLTGDLSPSIIAHVPTNIAKEMNLPFKMCATQASIRDEASKMPLETSVQSEHSQELMDGFRGQMSRAPKACDAASQVLESLINPGEIKSLDFN